MALGTGIIRSPDTPSSIYLRGSISVSGLGFVGSRPPFPERNTFMYISWRNLRAPWLRV